MTSSSAKTIVMIGPALTAPGGVSAVVTAYRDAGFFKDWRVRYINTYEKPDILTQLRVMTAAMTRYLWLLLSGQVRLLHVHSASRGSFWRKAIFCSLARLFRLPYVFHLHSGEFPVFYHQECSPMKQRFVRSTLENAAAVIALTQSWEKAIKSISDQINVVALGNFVVLNQHPVKKKSIPHQVLFLGRLREKKGIFDLLHAVPAILQKVPNVKFTFAGDGDLELIVKMATDLGVRKNVDLPGWVDGKLKDELLQAADILVLPSYFEGLPICILEAMATGVPVVSTRVGGIPEVLDDGNCGILIDPGSVAELADGIVSLLLDDALCERIRTSAFVRVEQYYSATAIITALSTLYQEILLSREAP